VHKNHVDLCAICEKSGGSKVWRLVEMQLGFRHAWPMGESSPLAYLEALSLYTTFCVFQVIRPLRITQVQNMYVSPPLFASTLMIQHIGCLLPFFGVLAFSGNSPPTHFVKLHLARVMISTQQRPNDKRQPSTETPSLNGTTTRAWTQGDGTLGVDQTTCQSASRSVLI